MILYINLQLIKMKNYSSDCILIPTRSFNEQLPAADLHHCTIGTMLNTLCTMYICIDHSLKTY